ncbi:MAG: methyltransferase domain-containing protein [Candidatus Omnitrophota bacterium]|nr:methyltransferase domain-containing protein [Candidatus Omnitrophota bacterium]
MIITKKEFNYILAHKKESDFALRVDFGLREIRVNVNNDEAFFENGCILSLKEKLRDNFCYFLDKEGLKPIAFFSENTNRFYKLTSTFDWPTISISSVPMHQLSSPCQDTQNKIELLKPYGVVLDTCMGLGYTAILAAKTANKVITFERDENVSFLAKINPLSQGLFLAKTIEIRQVDVSLGIKQFKDAYFDCIIHDPPTFTLSPELYALSFYGELYRVLKERGKLFHYTPLYKVSHGFDFPSKIKEKLQKTGFKVVSFSLKKGGVLCRK